MKKDNGSYNMPTEEGYKNLSHVDFWLRLKNEYLYFGA